MRNLFKELSQGLSEMAAHKVESLINEQTRERNLQQLNSNTPFTFMTLVAGSLLFYTNKAGFESNGNAVIRVETRREAYNLIKMYGAGSYFQC